MDTPKISVIMPVYNGEKYLKEAIESILNQTFKDFEFIIINDGSTDNSDKIINAYDDSRIKYLFQENKGLPATLNRGIEIATGYYIARMDQDDISHANRLHEEVNFLDQNPDIYLVGTWIDIIDDQSNHLSITKYPLTSNYIRRAMTYNNPFAHGSVMFRKKIVEKYNDNLKYAEDYDLWSRIAPRYETANIPKILYQWRVNPNGMSQTRPVTQDSIINGIQTKYLIKTERLFNRAIYSQDIGREIIFRGIRKVIREHLNMTMVFLVKKNIYYALKELLNVGRVIFIKFYSFYEKKI